MIPIEAEWHYIVNVAEDPENPKHAKWRGNGVVPEDRVARGYLYKIDTLTDVDTQRVLDKVENNRAIYKDVSVSTNNVYAFFMRDEGNYYTPLVVPFNEIKIKKKVYAEYVRMQRNALSR